MRLSRCVVGLALGVLIGCAPRTDVVLPELASSLVCFYDFDHPDDGDDSVEQDRGASKTPLTLINGGAAMRVRDGAHTRSTFSLQTRQIAPDTAGNDDWKAGVYEANGVPSLSAFSNTTGITLMGWVKPTGPNPGLNTTTPDPADRFGAVGLFGLLSGTSDGHGVRALLEVIQVSGTLRLVALGRRLDDGASLVLAADDDWRALLPVDTWTHLAATFDFDAGTMALYRNGAPLTSTYATDDDAWAVSGPAEPDRTSAAAPAGIKIGGSFPQNTAERNPFTGRLDDLMFFDTALDAGDVRRQYAHVTGLR